jgi:type VI secretion system protein ImpJ
MRDLQDFLSARIGRRAIRLEIIERANNAFVSTIRDRTLFRNATFVLEVAARRPLTEIQGQFPNLFKVGPNTKMNEIVHAHLPGVPLIHLPTPPPQIRAITDHVYFFFDRKSPLWPEFSTAASIGMHFSGDWPELELELWAVLEDRR